MGKSLVFVLNTNAFWNWAKEDERYWKRSTLCSSRWLSSVFLLTHSSKAPLSVLKLSQREKVVSEMFVILYYGGRIHFLWFLSSAKNLFKGINCDNSLLWIHSFCSIASHTFILCHLIQVSLSWSFMIKNLYKVCVCVCVCVSHVCILNNKNLFKMQHLSTYFCYRLPHLYSAS